jgi:hypothetical protein
MTCDLHAGATRRRAARCAVRWPRALLLPWLALLSLLALGLPARAATVPGDLPALVGRLSALAGEVSWYDRDSGNWLGSTTQQPLRNWPIAGGDRLRTGAGGRAELRIGSTTVRLGPNAELWLPQLDEGGVLLHLQAGSLAVRLADVDQDGFGPVTMLTREGRWLPMRPGHYRLDRERDATQATAWRGELRFEAHDSTLSIPAGRRADLWQDPPGTTRYAWAGVERDAFADWVARDERQDDAPITARHVPPGMTGWQDLDHHGDWIDDPEYGAVWQPRLVPPGWAPFHDGRWVWVVPWGWTWVDDAPWGFAPFHYGLWVIIGGHWCWSPGPRHQPPRYAPALSGWVSGANWGIRIGIGGHRPPPPRVVVPIGRPPVIVLPPPRPHEPVRPPFTTPREPDRRDPGRREHERREFDRREGDRHPPPPVAVPAPRPPHPEAQPPRSETRPDSRPAPRPESRPDRSEPPRDRGDRRGAAPFTPTPAPAAAVAPAAPAPPRTAEGPQRTLPTPVTRAPRESREARDSGPQGGVREMKDNRERREGPRGDEPRQGRGDGGNSSR